MQVLSLSLMLCPAGPSVVLAALQCLAAAPTLELSLVFIVLHAVEQSHPGAEQLYVLTQLALNGAAALSAAMAVTGTGGAGALCGLLHMHMVAALALDLWCQVRERGWRC